MKPRERKPAKSLRKEKVTKKLQKTGAPWGRAGSEYRPGLFIRTYLMANAEATCADVFYALKQDLKRINLERREIGDKPIKGCTYNSFAKYWSWYKKAGLIEPTGRTEPAIYDFLESRVFYRLSGSGDDIAWNDPVRAAHPEFR